MAKLSRTEKYKELRERLQNDNDADIHSPALSEYESRLNRIDANNFAAPSGNSHINSSSQASHAKREPSTSSLQNLRQDDSRLPSYDNLSSNENYTAPSFDNDYLNRYIQEVKQYNIDQGNAVSDRTEVNILNQLQNDRTPLRPFPSAHTGNNDSDFDDTGDGDLKPLRNDRPSQPVRQQNLPSEDVENSLNYTDQIKHPSAPGEAGQNNDFTDDLDFDDDPDAEPEPGETRDDIMAEVQSLVSGRNDKAAQPEPAVQPEGSVPSEKEAALPADNETRQQLINETSQIRAQLDDYGDNLHQVSENITHTNRIINTVLIVMIIALAVVLGVVIYWILRG